MTAPSGSPSAPRVRIFGRSDPRPPLDILAGPGKAVAVAWPGVGAELRSMHLVRLDGGSQTVGLRHPSEAVYYVIEGSGTVIDPDTRAGHDIVTGSMVHVEPGTAYRFEAGPDGLHLVGGPCPADPRIYGGT